MNKRKMTSVVLGTVGVLAVLSACSNDEEVINTNNIDGESEGDIEFTLFAADNNPSWNGMDSDVGQVILEETGVSLNASFAINDPAERIALFAAGGEYPDFILPKGDSGILVDAGAMIDLRPLIEEHAPNIQEVYGDYLDRMTWSDEDDAIYFIGTNPVDQQHWTPGSGFWLQHAVVEELGYPEINTVEDFENAIKEYYEMYPEINGQPTIPLSLLADDWRMLISVTNPAFWATGASDDGEWYIDDETREAILHYRRPEEREYFRWLNHMNAEGLLDPETFVQQEDQYMSKISSGRVLGMIDADWSIADAQTALREDGKYERMHGVYPVTLDHSYEHRNFQSTGYLSEWGIGITIDNPDPVRAIKFLDWMASEEAQILNNWGIEGEHYEVAEDGNRYLTDDQREERLSDSSFNERTGIGVYLAYGPHYGDGVLDSTGQPFTINTQETLIEDYTEKEKEVLEAYGANIWADLYPAADEFPVKPWGAGWEINWRSDSPIAIPFQRAQDIMMTRIPEAILADPEDFDHVYDRFMDELDDIGVENMEAEFTELVRQRVELWGED
ncbi:extracellular solute-binding protein [Salipaludibacillus agaradhaerens]|uniref:Extracellular solute-binding protein n=1 Tax=Salipaludibacillus agaradhaerens TaxID=76935 RepID=A0A9Q4B3J4_SALAG|nr:ABC transporter substrate-binding protein [Salipaludibacillus agaradhaerens]MCR6097672.1 extracellular solute-binding protein [Salipaludibacillus agaradhaerens]MCR6112844.1 extracellular solute-binding protein [Salipaludibacillus agaradhaerens]